MRLLVVSFAIVVLGLITIPLSGQIPPQQAGCQSSIQVEMPSGDIEIVYVESSEGMALIATCQQVSVKSQRLYLGDGKSAVLFQASNDGFFTPNGKVSAAKIELKKGHIVSVPKDKMERWGANRGEVYLQATGLKFTISDE
jgi:hypothetical protein